MDDVAFLPTNRELHQECVEWMEHRRGVATNLTDEWAVVMTRITEEQFEFSEQDKAWYMPYKGDVSMGQYIHVTFTKMYPQEKDEHISATLYRVLELIQREIEDTNTSNFPQEMKLEIKSDFYS